jgi:hypothetical protein
MPATTAAGAFAGGGGAACARADIGSSSAEAGINTAKRDLCDMFVIPLMCST